MPRFGDYVRAAFNARPIGMFVAPNWVGLAAFGLLGLTNPGFWVIGAGLELAYLAILATNPRFQRTVAASGLTEQEQDWRQKVAALVHRLDQRERQRYAELEARCRAIVDHQVVSEAVTTSLALQADSLNRLAWTYLRLLLMRQQIEKLLREAAEAREDRGSLEHRIRETQARLADPDLGEDLRRSLEGQIEILQQRLEKRSEAREKLQFLDAELVRIEQQVELIREQAALSTDPQVLSRRIDQITETLGGTSDWIREQQRVFGAMEDLLAEPPPLSPNRQAESQ
jgi:hypothetical protein